MLRNFLKRASFVSPIITKSIRCESTGKYFIGATVTGPPKSHSSALRFRPGKLAKDKKKLSPAKDSWSVVGYSTADHYNLLALTEKIIAQVSTDVVPK